MVPMSVSSQNTATVIRIERRPLSLQGAPGASREATIWPSREDSATIII